MELKAGSLATTVVNVFDLLGGAKTASETKKVETLLAALTTVAVSEQSVRIAAATRRELEARGQSIGMADYLIAGVCLERSAVLLTRNREHFTRVAGLTLAASGL